MGDNRGLRITTTPRPGIALATFDPDAYPFSLGMLQALDIDSFEEIGNVSSSTDRAGNNEANLRFRRSLKKMPTETPLIQTYHRFVADAVGPLFASALSYTQHPVPRVQIPYSDTISGLHRDADYTGRWDYINGWLPMTDTPPELALEVETGYGTDLFEPIPLTYGQVLFFDAAMLKHGSSQNETRQPRVSIDFRFVAKAPSALRSHLIGHRPPDLVKASQAEFRRLQAEVD